jgi:hypothetical protein
MKTMNRKMEKKNKWMSFLVVMDHMCVGRVILIWMLLSVTLGNSLFCTSRARDLLFQNLSQKCLGFNQFCGLCWGKKKTL